MSHTFRNAVGMPVLRAANGAFAVLMEYNSHAPWPVVPDNHGYFGAVEEVGFSLSEPTGSKVRGLGVADYFSAPRLRRAIRG